MTETVHMMTIGPVPPGISFFLRKTEPRDPQFAQALAEALAKVGIVKDKVNAEFSGVQLLTLRISPL